MLISAVQQSGSVLHLYIPFHILLHYALSQDTGYSVLRHTVGPSSLSILYVPICIRYSQTPNLSLPTPPPPLQPQVCL